MNIVLATSPSEEDKHGVRSMAPLSLGYLAACVKKYPEVKRADCGRLWRGPHGQPGL